MDLVASLHLDELPEQQTRISHLSRALAADSNLQLGFNACCACAKRLQSTVECRGCRRVKYCSESCRARDASSVSSDDEEALGHSSVVCALLHLCNADEDADDSSATPAKDEAAHHRVHSEYESYPATLANVLMDFPCYQPILTACARTKRKELVLHVVGASVDAELWGQDKSQFKHVLQAYAEALAELAEAYSLRTIRLHMIGPECPEKPLKEDTRIALVNSGAATCRLLVTTHQAHYSQNLLQAKPQEIPNAHVLVFFNPGFTCPDYSWDDTYASITSGTAFLVTTNTELEGIGDCQYLLEKHLLPSLPPIVAEIVGDEILDENTTTFFVKNPFAGSRVRQSGTMANDLFVKNSWILGGVIANAEMEGSSSARISFTKRERATDLVNPCKKRKGTPNTKKANPALI